MAKEISELTSCGVSLNEVREQLEDLNSARYDAEKGQGCKMNREKSRNCDCKIVIFFFIYNFSQLRFRNFSQLQFDFESGIAISQFDFRPILQP